MVPEQLTRSLAADVVSRGIKGVLLASGFRASRAGMNFGRSVPGGMQRIDMTIDVNPSWHPGSIFMYPQFELRLPAVKEIKKEMAAGDRRLGARGSQLVRQPLDWVAPKGHREDWYLESSSEVPALALKQASYFQKWVVPFCDTFVSSVALVEGYRQGDVRLSMDGSDRLTVVAALVFLDRIAEAREVAQREFGALGLRGLYEPVFRYLEAL